MQNVDRAVLIMSKKEILFDFKVFLFDGNDDIMVRIKCQYQMLLCHSYSRNNLGGSFLLYFGSCAL